MRTRTKKNLKYGETVPCLASTSTSTTSLLARFIGATYISLIDRFWSGGIRVKYISKGGTGTRTVRTAGTAWPKWDGGRLSGGDSGRADRDRKIFSGVRGCASLRNGVPRRDGGSDRRRRNWSGLARSTSRTAKTGVRNQHFSGWSRDRLILVYFSKQSSQKEFTRRNQKAFG